MMRRKETFTVITPIPGFIPRQLAIDILHSHSEVITLNPLVLDHKPISAPRDAAADEFYSTWYEITERVQVVPGMGKMGSSKISFNGCFHDMPWGLQTHIYAPLNIDMRNKYRIAGNQPGLEPPETREIGLEQLGAPKDGLYLREDIEIKCNITLTSFVKSTAKAASKEMVQRIIKKAELLDAGILQAMMHDGRLKTVNPMDRSSTTAEKMGGIHPMGSPSPSPGLPSYDNASNPSSPRNPSFQNMAGQASPNLGYMRPHSSSPVYNTYNLHGRTPSQSYQHQYHDQKPSQQQQQQPQAYEMAGDYQHYPANHPQGPHGFTAELPGGTPPAPVPSQTEVPSAQQQAQAQHN